MSFGHLVTLLLLGAIWGISFLFMRVAAPVMGPIPLSVLRILFSMLLVLLPAAIGRALPDLRTQWRAYLISGAFNPAIPIVLISAAAVHLSASLMAILNATAPLFTALVAVIWRTERLTPARVVGLVLGLIGVIIVVGWTDMDLTPATLLSMGAVLVAALSYGVFNVYVPRALGGVKGITLIVGQFFTASLMLLPFTSWRLPANGMTVEVVGSFAALVILCTVVGYLIFFHLLRAIGPTPTSTVSFLMPAFGILWGGLLLDERIGVATWVGFGFILSSVFLVNRFRGAR